LLVEYSVVQPDGAVGAEPDDANIINKSPEAYPAGTGIVGLAPNCVVPEATKEIAILS
jgi:hypothetical protein